jgi:hypothetical protein
MHTHFTPRLIASAVALALGVLAAPVHAGATKAAKPAVAATQQKTNAAFAKWADGFAADWVRLSPERATNTQYFSGAEQQALDRQLQPITDAQRDKQQAMARQGLVKLKGYLAGSLDDTQRNSAETMKWSLEQVIAGKPYQDHSFQFSQMGGTHVGLVTFLAETHPIRAATDVDSYLARLDQVAARMDEATARAAPRRRPQSDPTALHPRARPDPGRHLPQADARPERAGHVAGAPQRHAGRPDARSARRCRGQGDRHRGR